MVRVSSFEFRVSTSRLLTFLLVLVLVLALAIPAFAQSPSTAPADQLTDIGIIQRPGVAVPLDLTFEDETGQTLPLRNFFHHDRPVILQLGYFGCPMLCGLVSQGIVNSLRDINLKAGKDYDVIYISINPSETSNLALKKKESYLKAMGRPDEAAGWHLLTGKQSHIRQITDAVGFKYKWIEQDHQFAHPGGIIILSPDAHVSRYLGGIEFDPQTLRYSLVDASQGKVGSVSDKIWLTCFLQFDHNAGKYVLAATNIMRTASALTVLVVAFIIFRLLRREFAQRRNELPPRPDTTATQ